jgi:hypothetical protein
MQPSTEKEMGQADGKSSAGKRGEITDTQSRAWLVQTGKNITIAPRWRQVLVERQEADEEQSLPPLVCKEPIQIPIEGISQKIEPTACQSPKSKSQNVAL